MERRRLEEMDPEALESFRAGWCLGSEEFRRECLEKMEDKVGDNHPGVQGWKLRRPKRSDSLRRNWCGSTGPVKTCAAGPRVIP